MNDPIYTLGMLCVFHLIGGIGVGKGLRQLFARQLKGVLFFLVWGSMFGIMPLWIGSSSFARMQMPYAIYIELFVLIAAIAVTALLPQEIWDSLSSPPVIATGIGAIFFLAGLGGFFLILSQNVGDALLVGGIFMLVGGGTMAAGIAQAFKSR